MSEFVASAFVDVKPDIKGFRSDLKEKLNRSILSAGTFRIPIEAEPKRFRAAIAAEARRSPARIPVEIGTSAAEIRSKLMAKIESAKKGVSIKVPIEIVDQKGGTARGARRSSREGGEGETGRAERSTKKLTEVQKQRIAVGNTLADVDKKLAITARNLADANTKGLSAEEKTIRLRDARTSANAAVRRVTDQLAISEATLTQKQRASLESALANARGVRASVTEKQKLAASNAVALSVEDKITKARAHAATVLGVEVKTIKQANTLHILENDLMAVEARLKTLTNKARDAGLHGRVAENQLLLQEIALRKAAVIAQRDELRGEGKRLTQQKTGLRGAAASLLSLLGIRGATLAASGAFLAGAAAVAVFAKSLGSFAKFETELNVFQAVTGATADEMRAVAAAAKELGRDVRLPAVTATDAAQAMSELSRAGLDVRDSIAGARGVLELAAAAQISNAEAATLASSALNAFGLSGNQAIRVADLLANAANAAQGSIAEMGAAMQQASAIARLVGLSLEDTVGILTLFARNGLRGSDAGTSLRTALSRLIAPTKDASALLDELGINVRDLNGNVRADVFAQFGAATRDLSPVLRDMIAQTIAGQDAIRAFAIGAREGERGLERVRLQMSAEGTAARVAAARSKGLAGSFAALASNAQTLGTTLGGLAAGPVQVLVKQLNAAVEAGNKFAQLDMLGGIEALSRIDLISPRNEIEGIIEAGKGIKNLDFGQVAHGVGRFAGVIGRDDPADKVKELVEQLALLEQLRLQRFDLRLNTSAVTKDIKEIRKKLKGARIEAGDLIPFNELGKAFQDVHKGLELSLTAQANIDTKSPAVEASIKEFQARLQKAAEIRTTLKGLKAEKTRLKLEGADTSAVEQDLQDMRKKLIATLKGTKVEMEKALTGKGIGKNLQKEFAFIAKFPVLATPEVLGNIDKMIAQIKAKGPLAGRASKTLGADIAKGLQSAIDAAIKADDPDLAASLKAKADKLRDLFGVLWAESFKNIKVPLTGDQIAEALLPAQIASARAEAFGGVGDQIQKKIEERATLMKLLRQAQSGSDEELGLINDIGAIDDTIASLREDTATKTKERNDKADEKVLDAIGTEERKRQNALLIAQQSESLADDIAAQRKLRGFYLAKIKEVRATVRDAETRADQLKDLNQNLFELEQDIASDVRDRRKQIRENRAERLELKIQITQDTDNVNAEIRAREAQIRNTQKLIGQTRKGSLQRLRLIAQLRKEQRELRELKDEKAKVTDEARKMIFEFLQTQQGFAANLLGNLIPAGVTGLTGRGGGGPAGAGGGPLSGPGAGRPGAASFGGGLGGALIQEAGLAAGAKGPSQGQFSELIEINRQMARLLARIAGDAKHPEAKRSKMSSRAMLDMLS